MDTKSEMLSARAVALHNLICAMLRSTHVQSMPPETLRKFTYRAGVALHNLPQEMLSPEGLTHSTLKDVNAIDPSANSGQWGCWATELAHGFGVSLPPSP